MPKILWIGLLLFLPARALLAQSPEECLALVRQTYQKINRAATDLQEQQVYRFKAAIRAEMRDSSKFQTKESTFEMIVGKHQAHYLTEDLIFYMDEREAFTIIPTRKVIYRSDSGLQLMRSQGVSQQLLLQDTLFTMCTVTKCRDIRDHDQGNKLVELTLDPQAQQLFRMKTLTVYLDTRKQLIRKFLIAFSEQNEMKSMEITCEEIDFYYKKAALDTPVYELIFSQNGRLLPQYQEYQVVDARVKK